MTLNLTLTLRMTLKSISAIFPRLFIVESRIIAHFEGLGVDYLTLTLNLTLTLKMTLKGFSAISQRLFIVETRMIAHFEGLGVGY